MGDKTSFDQAAASYLAGTAFATFTTPQQAEARIIISDLVGRIGHVLVDRLVLGQFPPSIAANENYIRAIVAHHADFRCAECVLIMPFHRASSL